MYSKILAKSVRAGIVAITMAVFTSHAYTANLNLRSIADELTVDESEQSAEEVTVSVSSESGDSFALKYTPHPQKRTVIQPLLPEGITGRIYEKNKVVYEDEIPFSFVAKPDMFYKVEVDCPSGKWSKKIEAKAGQIAKLEVLCSPTAPTTELNINIKLNKSHTSTGQPPTPEPMNSAELRELKNALKSEAFESGKVALLKDASKNYYFTSDQVGTLLDLFEFDNDKVEAAATCYPRVVDKENFFVVYSHFEFDASKEELREKIRELEGGKSE